MITLLEGYSFAWRHDVAHDDDDGHKILLWTAKLLPTQNALPLMSLSEVSRCRRVRVRERERESEQKHIIRPLDGDGSI